MRFSRLQLSFVLLLFIGISNHVLILPHLLGIAKRDAWICILIGYAILILWAVIFTLIFSKNKERVHLLTWLKLRTGNLISYVIMFLFLLYILVISFISLFDLIQTMHIYFLPMTSTWVIILPFLLLCIWAASAGLKTIVYTSAVVLPIVWMLGYFVAFTTMEEKDYSYLFPIFSDDEASLLNGIVVVLGGSVDLLVLFLMQHYFNKPITYVYLFILITFLISLILGPTMGSIASFGPSVAENMRFPAFEQWRLVTIGELISHVDSLAVFQLLSGVVIRVTLCLFFIPEVFNIQSEKIKKTMIIVFAFCLMMAANYQISDILVQKIIKEYFYKYSLLFGAGMTFLLLIISYLPRKKGLQKYE